jgi:hypothetical protein
VESRADRQLQHAREDRQQEKINYAQLELPSVDPGLGATPRARHDGLAPRSQARPRVGRRFGSQPIAPHGRYDLAAHPRISFIQTDI